LINNGYDVAVMEHHVSSSYSGFTNAYSQARISYYGISGIPNSYFDGITNVVGGYSGTYSEFLAKYNQRIAIPSNFTIAINGMNNGLNYTVVLTMENVYPYSGTNLVAHLALTESNLNYGGSTYNHVTRLFVPNASGTSVNFTSNPIQTVVLNFTKNASWVISNCELIAFIQNNTTKEILQAISLPLNDLLPMSTDAAITSVYNVPVTSCSGKASPYLKIKNTTTTNLSVASIKYKINEGPLLTYNWSGNLSLNQESLFQLPQMTFSPLTENLFTAYIATSNGGIDPNHLNDTIHKSFVSTESYFSTINLELKTDNNPQQTTWQILNANSQIVFSGGPYTGLPNTLIQQALEFQQSGCYKFVINDSGNDGICCTSGNGYFMLKDINSQLIYSNGDFGPKETVEIGMKISIFDLTVFLEGPFNTSSFEMNTTLNQGSVIPLHQPYNTAPWNYNGSENVTNIPSDVVDWVLVELRETTGGPETATSNTIIGRQAAFVTNFGKVVSLDGISFLRFDVAITNNLFIVIHHRNHLSIMNANALANFGGIFNFDFTGSVDYLYGGLAGCKDIEGSAAMAAGDGNGDGVIDLFDKNFWTGEGGKKGYILSDYNLDQHVNNQDKNGFWHSNYLMESQIPD
jgi:hypothetical protein